MVYSSLVESLPEARMHSRYCNGPLSLTHDVAPRNRIVGIYQHHADVFPLGWGLVEGDVQLSVSSIYPAGSSASAEQAWHQPVCNGRGMLGETSR